MIYYFFLIWSLFFLFLFFSLVFLLIFYWFSISFFNQILWCIIFSYLILMFFYFFSFVKVIFLFNLTSNQKTFVPPPPFIFYFYFHPYSFNCILYLRSFFTSNLMTQIINLEYWWGLKSFLLLLIFFFNFIIWHYFFIYIKRLPLWFSSIFFLGYLDFMTWTTGFAS